MNLEVSYDSSAATAPAWFQSAVSCVVSQYDALITNPVTVTINVGWGEENGNAINASAVADNQSSGTYMSYAALTTAMESRATSTIAQTAVANLPSADFTNGGKFYVPLAEQKALGIQSASSTEVDGYVGLSSSRSYTFSPSGQIASGTYDAIGILDHEISEVLGRVDFAGQGSSTGTYTPMDLFRYSAPGERSLTSGSGNFSIDGQTMLQSFGNPGDAADWNPGVTGDVFANATAGVASHFSATDLTMLAALGYGVDPDALSSTANSGGAQSSSPAPLTIHPNYNADVQSQGGNDTFVFSRYPGDVVVSDFVASGANHDTLSLSNQSFNSIAAVLRHTTSGADETVIHLSKTDKIELAGVTRAELRANPSVFAFHA